MTFYKTNQIAQGFYSIDFENMVRCFLFIGDKEALLIDTCTGAGNIKEVVDGLTNLPVMTLFTHADGDHVGAARYFNKRFMHPSEFDHYAAKNENILSMAPVWEGDTIDIGSYRFEVILIPGHTPGSIALLEKEKRFLIGGDSIQTGGAIFMFGGGRNFEAYRASMKKMQGRLTEFDIVYSSHNDLTVIPDTVNALYAAAGKMIDKSIKGQPAQRFDGKVSVYNTDGVAFFA